MIPVHDIAGLWPAPTADDYADIREAIRREGLLVPVVVWRGMLVDGRQRQRACDELDIEIRTDTWPSDLDERSVAMRVAALHARRNLTVSQKGITAALLATRYQPAARERQREAGEMYGERHPKSLAPIGAKLSPPRSGSDWEVTS